MTKIGDVATDKEVEVLVNLAMFGHIGRHCGWCCKKFETRQELEEARWSHIGPVHAECYEREKRGEAPSITHLIGKYVQVSNEHMWVMGELRLMGALRLRGSNFYIVTTLGPSGKEEAAAMFGAKDVWFLEFFGETDADAGNTNIHIRLRPHERRNQ